MPKSKGFNWPILTKWTVENFTFWYILCKIFKNSTWGALGLQMLLSNSSHHPLFSASQKWGGDFVAFSEYMYIWTLTFYFLKIFSNFRTMCNNAGRFARLVVTRQKLPAAKANYWPYNMFTPQFWQGRGTLRARWSTCIGCLIFVRNDIKCQKICGFMLFVICSSWFLYPTYPVYFETN